MTANDRLRTFSGDTFLQESFAENFSLYIMNGSEAWNSGYEIILRIKESHMALRYFFIFFISLCASCSSVPEKQCGYIRETRILTDGSFLIHQADYPKYGRLVEQFEQLEKGSKEWSDEQKRAISIDSNFEKKGYVKIEYFKDC